MSNRYRKGSHCKYSLKAHVILVTKYRKKILYDKISDVLKQIIYKVSELKGYDIIRMETDKDHIHILIEYKASDSISNIVKILKQYTTYILWKLYNDILLKFYWKRKIIWSEGYFACSIGQVFQSIIEKYIESQG